MISDNAGGLPRYCHPYHGGWDVARIALDIPESRILLVCPVSCARIICLNAVKYDYKDRINVLALTEDDIVSGAYEQKTVEAACRVLEDVSPRPKALILYVSCIDAMLGNDHSFQCEEIMERFPGVNCFVLKMCPITRYSGDLPLVALQRDMYAALPDLPKAEADGTGAVLKRENTVAFIGTNIALSEDNELVSIIKSAGLRPLHIQASDSYGDFLAVRKASLVMSLMPFGSSAAKLLKERFGIPFIPYFAKYDLVSIRKTVKDLCEAIDAPIPDMDAMEKETMDILRKTAEAVGDTELIIDSTATLFPDALRDTLKAAGFKIASVLSDDAARTAPDVDSGSINVPRARSYGARRDAIAIGMVASSFEGTTKSVDIFYDSGDWGHQGLRSLAGRILEASKDPKTAEDIRKEARR
ncbi:MAG: hypothetical protein IJM17_05790 [Firmicutes bacterium]|nr:hypothetical protein [Bacillota bacterium]